MLDGLSETADLFVAFKIAALKAWLDLIKKNKWRSRKQEQPKAENFYIYDFGTSLGYDDNVEKI